VTAVPTPKAHDHLVDLPEPVGYRIKKRVLGPPIYTDRLAHERLGKPTALAVFASDCVSSSAYASEEILRVLIPAVGLFAFSMVVPVTVAMIIVLGFLILSYRQTIKEYPSAGGAYIVTKDNFGIFWAQIAGVSLLTDYVLTVAVSTAAGAAALASAFEVFEPWVLPVSITFVLVIAGGNLKGVKESGKAFAIPTYFFIANMAMLLVAGIVKLASGTLEAHPACGVEGTVPCGQGTDSVLFFGATLFVVLHAFASGGAAVTGVEAISNGVPAFREPSWRNARTTLVIMGSLLAVMFFGISFFASKVHAIPYEHGTPTVIAQVGEYVYGTSGVGQVLFYALQAGTMLILVLAANTSFADFPRLASFQAEDNFMPKQLTKRGHRLVFSNGIIILAAAAIVLLLVTGAKVERLIPMYAIGVFLSFTLSQAGMAKHHVRKREPGWKRGLFVNATGALLSLIVLLIFATTKFHDGAWVIIVLIPILVIPVFRLNKAYAAERTELVEDAHTAAAAPILDRHVVFVMLDELDMASARAIQYARTLMPDELIAVHFDLDPLRTKELTTAWSKLGFNRLSLDVIECPDRRIERAAAEVVARQLARADTEVSVLLPRREYSRLWHRLVHDQTASRIAKVLEDLPHCNVTIVPYHLGSKGITPKIITPVAPTAVSNGKGRRAKAKARELPHIEIGDIEMPTDRVPIADVSYRQSVRLAGKVYSVRVQPWSGVAVLELTLIDDTGAMQVVFFGRRELPGVTTGTKLVVEGMVGEHRGKMAILNPRYEIQAST